jgi:GNAT superfamily N-acetyltransferase
MNVIAEFQKHGIGTALIREAERIAVEHGKDIMGIGFGLTADYGALSGYIPKWATFPDGRGAQPTPWGDVLFLTKRLK